MIDAMQDIVKQKMQYIVDQQEEILTAFIAKYQCQPDEVIQIYEKDAPPLRQDENGNWFLTDRWYCIKRTEPVKKHVLQGKCIDCIEDYNYCPWCGHPVEGK